MNKNIVKNYFEFYNQRINGRTCPFIATKTLEKLATEQNCNISKLTETLNLVFNKITCTTINNDIALSGDINLDNCAECDEIKQCSAEFGILLKNEIERSH